MLLYVRSPSVPLDSIYVQELVNVTYLTQFSQVATVTLVVYDIMITMDKEIKFFWKIPRSIVDIVFFANRYTAIFGSISFLFYNTFSATLLLCDFSSWTFNIATGGMNIVLIDYILLMRVLALYSQDKKLSKLLVTLLVLEACLGLSAMIYLNVVLQYNLVAVLARDVAICVSPGDSTSAALTWAAIGWAIPLSYGTLLLILALYKAAKHWKISTGFGGSRLIKVVIEDHILYFVIVIVCSVINVLAVNVSNDVLYAVLLALGNPALLSILGSRMLLNLKEAGERGENGGTSCGAASGTISEMDFSASANRQQDIETSSVLSDEGSGSHDWQVHSLDTDQNHL